MANNSQVKAYEMSSVVGDLSLPRILQPPEIPAYSDPSKGLPPTRLNSFQRNEEGKGSLVAKLLFGTDGYYPLMPSIIDHDQAQLELLDHK